jgi:HSP20 family protein
MLPLFRRSNLFNLDHIWDLSIPEDWFLPAKANTWYPAADLSETKEEIKLELELPGIDPQKVDISLEDGNLVIKGERKWDCKKEACKKREIFQGSFIRYFSIPKSVDSSKISADYDAGILTLTLPKKIEQPSKKIEIKVKD